MTGHAPLRIRMSTAARTGTGMLSLSIIIGWPCLLHTALPVLQASVHAAAAVAATADWWEHPLLALRLAAGGAALIPKSSSSSSSSCIVALMQIAPTSMPASCQNPRQAGDAQALSYIGTQGPLPSTVSDFWRMVAVTNTSAVVMLTSLTDGCPTLGNSRPRCAPYFPDKEQDVLRLPDSITITCVHKEQPG